MSETVLDLDALRPAARWVKLAGHRIDVSYVPCGITFEVDEVVRELNALDHTALRANGEATRQGFALAVRLCSLFCSHEHPEMDERWFLEHTDPRQVQGLAEAIKDALVRSYAGIEGGDGKNS